MSYQQPKVALVHDDFIQQGGAENLFAAITQIWPDAPIYTSLVDWDKLPAAISRNRVRPSFMQIFQKYAIARKWYKALLPLYPLAFESFNFGKFDVVISSTTRFAKSIITKPQTIHICYINSVPRFLWNERAMKEYLPQALRILFSPFLKWLEKWDKIASARPDYYIANSENVAKKVQEHYGIKSEVIYPFVDLNLFKPKERQHVPKDQEYYLLVSRLVKWKKIDIAIKAAKNLGSNLKIVGTGPDEARLRRIASNVIPAKAGIQNKTLNWIPDQVRNDKNTSVEFLGTVDRSTLIKLYQNAKALIVTQEEDFGIAIVEAQACGIPVIAYKKGGQKEIIKEDKTGIFFDHQTSESLKDAIIAASRVKWSDTACRENALRFSQAVFVKELKSKIAKHAKPSQRS